MFDFESADYSTLSNELKNLDVGILSKLFCNWSWTFYRIHHAHTWNIVFFEVAIAIRFEKELAIFNLSFSCDRKEWYKLRNLSNFQITSLKLLLYLAYS